MNQKRIIIQGAGILLDDESLKVLLSVGANTQGRKFD